VHCRWRSTVGLPRLLLIGIPMRPSPRPLAIVTDQASRYGIAHHIATHHVEVLIASDCSVPEARLPERPNVAGLPCKSRRPGLPALNERHHVFFASTDHEMEVIGHQTCSEQLDSSVIHLGEDGAPHRFRYRLGHVMDVRMGGDRHVKSDVWVGVRLPSQPD
jgi:hypothetical protein